MSSDLALNTLYSTLGNSADLSLLQPPRAVVPAAPELEIILDPTACSVVFNVMPDRPVSETMFIKEYHVGHRYGEAHFSREYKTSMINSPDHLIFLTALVHTQKLIYVMLCKEFGIKYDSHAPEVMKIWPTKMSLEMPRLITQTEGLVQKLWITELKKLRAAGQYLIKVATSFEDTVKFSSTLAVYVL